MGEGINIRAAHFPGRAPIDAYGDGGFRFAEMSHRGSIMCLPSGVHGWNVTEPSQINEETLSRVIGEAAEINILLVGTGVDLVPFPRPLREQFRELGISVNSMSTGAAVRTYNVLLAEDRAVAAVLLAVE